MEQNITITTDLTAALDLLCRKIGLIIDWSNESILPYLQDLLNRFIQWRTITYCYYSGICGFFLILSIIMITLDIKKIKSNGLLCGIFGVVGLFSLVMIFCFGYEVIQCIYMPEMELLEYLKSLS